MWYKIDFTKLAVQLLPPVLRSPLLVALLRALLVPARQLYGDFVRLKERADDRLGITAHVLQLERALNDAFFLKDRQIHLETPEGEPPRILYHEAEGQSAAVLHLAEEEEGYHVWRRGESLTDINFTVMVPTFLCTSTESREDDRYHWQYYQTILNLIKTYKPAGRTLSIELYDYE